MAEDRGQMTEKTCTKCGETKPLEELQVLEGDLVDALKHVRQIIKAG